MQTQATPPATTVRLSILPLHLRRRASQGGRERGLSLHRTQYPYGGIYSSMGALPLLDWRADARYQLVQLDVPLLPASTNSTPHPHTRRHRSTCLEFCCCSVKWSCDGWVRTSPAPYTFVQPDREHRDTVSVLPCSPRKEKTDLEKYNRAHSLAARIVANVAIWSILLYGIFFMGAFKDYSFGFELTILSACGCFHQPSKHLTHQANCCSLALALHQHGIRAFALQWVFAIVIASLLLLAALAISLPPVEMLCTFLCDSTTNAIQIFDKELIWRRLDDDSDCEVCEREPLLGNE